MRITRGWWVNHRPRRRKGTVSGRNRANRPAVGAWGLSGVVLDIGRPGLECQSIDPNREEWGEPGGVVREIERFVPPPRGRGPATLGERRLGVVGWCRQLAGGASCFS